VPPEIVIFPAKLLIVLTIESEKFPLISIPTLIVNSPVSTYSPATMLDRVIARSSSVMPEMRLCWVPGINSEDADTTLP
jgi:hypothetical protein